MRSLVARHRPGARTVLELACGTGSILAFLRNDYAVTGLDRSAEMLAVAREKLPDVPLVEGDMTSFELDERFDVVLCVYDSINHLLEYGQWESVFERAHAHLGDGGIFVFDINTERRLAALSELPAVVSWFGDGNLLVMDVDAAERGASYVWNLRVFEHEGSDRYRLHVEAIPEASFPRERIVESLRACGFRRVAVSDRRRARPSRASERLHFVATR